MTLRVEVSIIPFGSEKKKRIIETLNISNIGEEKGDLYNYIVEQNTYKTYDDDTPVVQHFREEGALTLIRKSLERLGY